MNSITSRARVMPLGKADYTILPFVFNQFYLRHTSKLQTNPQLTMQPHVRYTGSWPGGGAFEPASGFHDFLAKESLSLIKNALPVQCCLEVARVVPYLHSIEDNNARRGVRRQATGGWIFRNLK
jgi:hypothetical protein